VETQEAPVGDKQEPAATETPEQSVAEIPEAPVVETPVVETQAPPAPKVVPKAKLKAKVAPKKQAA